MAKKSMIEREVKRAKTVARYAARRATLLVQVLSPQPLDEDLMEALA